jgi:hypothetical protein
LVRRRRRLAEEDERGERILGPLDRRVVPQPGKEKSASGD